MGNQNSHVLDTILGVYRETCFDLYDSVHPLVENLSKSRARREATRDYLYIERRARMEGFRFLTTVLPKLGKYVDGLLSGKTREMPEGISQMFLHFPLSYLRSLVSCDDADQHQAKLVKRLRTLLYLTYKLELPSDPQLDKEAIASFVKVETEVSEFQLPADNAVLEYGRHVVSWVLRDLNLENLSPRHGPGAVATGEEGDAKWVFTHWYQTLHQFFPYYDYMYGMRSNGRTLQLAALASRYKSMIRLPYPTARLCLVPKDSRGPRVISCEPLELQYMQQAVAPILMQAIERNTRLPRTSFGDTRPASRINFIDQTINANIALFSSRESEFATLDLAEASDRVGLALFRALWPSELQPLFEALRSHATQLPNGEEITLNKFAPMGSALCFPVESVLFFAICAGALMKYGYTFERAVYSVFVYGDDIIVPTETYTIVKQALEHHGLKVNDDKSFFEGYFRESCGCDAWLGHDVTPIKLKKLPGHRPTDGTAHVAWVAYSSNFISAGMRGAGTYCKQVVENVLGWIPTVTHNTGYLAVVDPENPSTRVEYKGNRWSAESSSYIARCWAVKTRSAPSMLNEYDRLLKNVLTAHPERDPSQVVVKDATQISRRTVPISVPL